jgi:hypothetical protein
VTRNDNNNNSIALHQSKNTPMAKDMKHTNEVKHDYNNQLVNTYCYIYEVSLVVALALL